MKKTKLFLILFALLAFGQTAWAQTPEPSTSLEPLSIEGNGRQFYKFNYPSTSATGEPVVLSSLLACWAPQSPQSGDAIESVHMFCHYTITANSQCPTNMTSASFDLIPVALLTDGSSTDANRPFRSVVTRSIVIMPDYEGYGVSSDRTHPYLAEAITAQQVVDAVTYGLGLYNDLVNTGDALSLKSDWRSFSLGYSQGGSVALAVQRYIEQNNLGEQLHFRGTLCGDGPYDLIATLRYYMDDDGDSYGVSTDHRAGQATLPVVLPMILKGMIASDPNMANHNIEDYLSESFLATGIMEWLASKTLSNALLNDEINAAWLAQLNNGSAVVNGQTYTAPANMDEMFVEKTVVLLSNIPVVWANLDKILTTGFYNYLNNADNFNSVPAATGNPYQDLHHALAANDVCTGWEPTHRIQFMHSKGDMVVPYGNYLAFRNAHPEDENNLYYVDNTYSSYDHQRAGYDFLTRLNADFIDYFEWIDNASNVFAGQGTENSPYLITSEDDWNQLAGEVSSGNTYSGKCFQLTDSISVTEMVGTSSKKFSGTFDGNGYTLTFNKESSEQYIAPFRYINGATIKNLKVTGTVISSNKFAGGVVAHATGSNTITNCLNSTIINATSTSNYNGSHGGILGQLGGSNNSVTISGCLFNGKMLGTYTDYWCGIIGYYGSNSVTISNCFFNPEEINVRATNNNYTICRPGPTVSNCYYNAEATEMSQKQGQLAHSITGGEHITVEFASAATAYPVSGITGYLTGLQYGDTLYSGSGNQVRLTLGAAQGYSIIGSFSVNAGTLTHYSEDYYTLLMPNQDVIISATTQLVAVYREIAGYNHGGGWYLIASPMEGTITPTEDNGFLANEFDLYRFNQAAAPYEWENWKTEGSDHYHFNLENGRGYLYANSEGTTLIFAGTPLTETETTVELTYTEGVDFAGWNLVGNPFAETAYLGDRSFYTMGDNSMEIVPATPGDAIQPMEGVFVIANEDSETLTFSTEIPAKGAMLALNLTRGNGMVDRAIVRFDEGSTLPKLQLNENSTKVYLPMDDKDYAVARGEGMGELPVNFKAEENGTYTLSFSNTEVEFSYLHLIDNLTGNDVDLLPLLRGQGGLNQPATYTFTAKTTDYESRFKLVFASSICEDANGDNAFAFISNGNIIVNGEGTLQVIDVMGRIIISRDAARHVSTNRMTPGVYVLRLINGDDVRTQKIIVK